MKIAIVDNYDSFTYNLAHLVRELGVQVEVFRNDQYKLHQLESFQKIILSPGPGIPEEAGLLLDTIRYYAGKIPMLGVCLGHQAIAEVFGASLINLSEVFHGVATPCKKIVEDELFNGLPATFSVGRYHSWVVSDNNYPDCLEVTARSIEGQIMALRHRQYDIRGIQFHPESILTPDGPRIISNWLEL